VDELPLQRSDDEITGTESLDVATVNYRTTNQVAYLQCDSDTLEAHSNVAGTGKTGGKVVTVLAVNCKSVLAVEKPLCRSGVCFPQGLKILADGFRTWVSETGKRKAETHRKCEMQSETESAFWLDPVTG
jgi:hypothetical protein